ncbi:MAG: hypothetical protein ABI600_14670 [Luteolibacter sp.]
MYGLVNKVVEEFVDSNFDRDIGEFVKSKIDLTVFVSGLSQGFGKLDQTPYYSTLLARKDQVADQDLIAFTRESPGKS